MALHLEAARSGRTVLDLEGLRVELAGRVLVDELTLSLVPGERVGIVGPNGTGKTTLLRTILGELAPSERRGAQGEEHAHHLPRAEARGARRVEDRARERRGRTATKVSAR